MRKLKLLPLVFLLNMEILFSQNADGIKFIETKNWEEIKLEAKRTNKYIFIDAYTTWCAPCKFMAKEIFTKKESGDYFNKNFLNVAVQFDKTKADDDNKKKWYNDVKQFEIKYKIDSYPTYLFFNPDGELVYKIIGASENAINFISKASNALIEEKQYYLLKTRYEKGDDNIELIKKLLNAAKFEKDEVFLSKVGNKYLINQKDILTKENINVISVATINSSDVGFDALRFNEIVIDSILGKGKSFEIINEIILNEITIPYLRNGGKKIDMGGGMLQFTGVLNENVNWLELEKKINLKYPEISKKIISRCKPLYFEWLKDWKMFSETSIDNINSYPELLNDDLLGYYMWTIIRNSDDKIVVQNTINWVNETTIFKEKKNPFILTGYATLLYKCGNKSEAFKNIIETIEIAKKMDLNNYAARLESLKISMEKGERTW